MTTTFIGSGVTSSGLIVNNGNLLAIGSGGTTSNTTVLFGGSEDPEAGGLAINVTVSAGGYLIGKGDVGGDSNIYGTINGVTLVASGASSQSGPVDIIRNGATAINVTVDAGVEEYVSPGAVASGGVVSIGGTVEGRGGLVSGLTVSNGGAFDVDFSGQTANDVILSGGTAFLFADGAGLFVKGGGTLVLGSVISSGQTVVYEPSITATSVVGGATLSSGAILTLSGTDLDGTLSLTSGAPVAENIYMGPGGVLLGPGDVGAVSDEGTVSGVHVVSGGLWVAGKASGDTISAGASETVNEGIGGGEGIATGETITSGASQTVSEGGEALQTIVRGGVERISVGGFASGTIIESGGTETIWLQGVARATTISSGYEYDYGNASGTAIFSGGHEIVLSDAVASNSVISSGGGQIVSIGGTTIAPIVLSGGTLTVMSDGKVSGGLTIAGGAAKILGLVSAGQTVSFTGATGVLTLDNLAGFGAQISGLLQPGQKIDLGRFAYSGGETVSWTQSGTSGTLTVSDGAQTANLTLDGTYVSGDFTLSTDSSGGTYVADPRPAVGFAQAIAAFSGREQGFAAIHAGGSALMSASPLATAATSGR
jgi:fibronectin-binding autotransporter adhesin